MKTILYFTSRDCPTCPRVKPSVDKLKGKYNVKEIDAVDHPKDVARYDIMGLPTVILLDENGEFLQRWTGASPRIIKEIEAL